MTQENAKVTRDKRLIIQFRVTQEEKEMFTEAANEEGMSVTDVIKFRTIKKEARFRVATPIRKTMIGLSAKLGKIASNVDQIRKVVNDKNYYSGDTKNIIGRTLTSVRSLSDKILNELYGGRPTWKVGVEMLSGLSAELKEVGDGCNDIAKAMNNKGYYSITIKEPVIVQVMNRISLLSNKILNILQGDDTGRDTGERGATGDVSADES